MNQVDETDINKLSDKTIIFGWVPSFVLKKKIKSSLPFSIGNVETRHRSF